MVKSGTVAYVKEGIRGDSEKILGNSVTALTLSAASVPFVYEKDGPVTSIDLDLPKEGYHNGGIPKPEEKVSKKNVIVHTDKYQNGGIPKPGDKAEIYGIVRKSICKRGQRHFGLLGSERTLDGHVIEKDEQEFLVIDSDHSKVSIAKKPVYKVKTDIGEVMCDGGFKPHKEGDFVEVKETLRKWSQLPSYSLTE